MYKLKRYSLPTSEFTVEAETGRAELYTKAYLEGLKLGVDLPSTELQSADDLVLLAANSYVSLWKLTGDDGYLRTTTALLEYALTKSKQSFLARLMLIRIYRILGTPYHLR